MVDQRPQNPRPGDVGAIDAGGVPGPSSPGAPPSPAGPNGWTAGRIIALVAGSVLALITLGVFGSGATLLWADQTQRVSGYLPVHSGTYSTSGYALASDQIVLHGGWEFLEPLVGQARIQVTSTDPAKPVFVAVGPAGQISSFLAGTRYTTITDSGGTTSHYGSRVPGSPGAAGIWTLQVSGAGTQTLRWTPDTGTWIIMAMNHDGSAGLAIRAKIAIAAPMLFRVSVELLVSGALLGVLAAALIAVPIRLASVREDLRGP